jgi:tRNA threonylcarbamoyladenosine biosynthesis protein TsaB
MSSGFNCLAIETATSHCSIAACVDEQVEIVRLTDHRASSRQLYQAVNEVFANLGLMPAMLDCVAFGCGPGSFTGIRIAAAAAQGIAFAQSVPVCRVSTLAAMAVAAKSVAGGMPVAVCMDARQAEVYLGVYGWDPSGQPVPLQPDALLRPTEFSLEGRQGPMLAIGNGWSAWPELHERNRALIVDVLPDVWPDALSVLNIARGQFAAGQFVAPAEALPNYIRNQVTQ